MGNSLKTRRFDEFEIKCLVLNELRSLGRIDRKSVIASEFYLGRSGVRVDLAIWSDDFVGVEIKSEFDSLRRLDSQLRSYRAYCAQTILVVASRHLKVLDRPAIAGVEVWEVGADGRIRIAQASEPVAEPQSAQWSDLMTQSERRRFARSDLETADREAFGRAFRERFVRSSQDFWAAVGRRKIKPEHLWKLSRYRDARLAHAAWASAQAAKRELWLQNAEAELSAASNVSERDRAA